MERNLEKMERNQEKMATFNLKKEILIRSRMGYVELNLKVINIMNNCWVNISCQWWVRSGNLISSQRWVRRCNLIS